MFCRFPTRRPARRSLRFFNPLPRTGCPRAESGYALVMAMFLIVAMIVSSQVVLRNMITLRRREREADTIWRGQQYERAIRLYYRKSGHYPQSLDDLKKGMPELHFLRFSTYKDPVNTTDGSWRFIYVNGTGSIIGSVRFATLQQMALIDLNGGKLPGPQPGTPVADLASNSDSNNANAASNSNDPNAAANSNAQSPQPQQGQPTAPQPSQSSSSGSAFATPGASPGAAGATSIGTGPNGALGQSQTANPLLLLKPTGPVDGPVLGAFITGVASKVDKPSIKVYKTGKKYIDWEFIWNPLEDQARAVQNGLSPQGSPLQQPGQFGLPIGPVNGAAPGQPGGTAGPMMAPQSPSTAPQAPPPASNPN